MTREEWLAYARQEADALCSLVSSCHPASPELDPPTLSITAPGAEAVCQTVRRDIAASEVLLDPPADRLRAALNSGDLATIESLLSSAWFGVPESRDCWKIWGFAQAVKLLEDWPEIADQRN